MHVPHPDPRSWMPLTDMPQCERNVLAKQLGFAVRIREWTVNTLWIPLLSLANKHRMGKGGTTLTGLGVSRERAIRLTLLTFLEDYAFPNDEVCNRNSIWLLPDESRSYPLTG
jgi:hypothetical protein